MDKKNVQYYYYWKVKVISHITKAYSTRNLYLLYVVEAFIALSLKELNINTQPHFLARSKYMYIYCSFSINFFLYREFNFIVTHACH